MRCYDNHVHMNYKEADVGAFLGSLEKVSTHKNEVTKMALDFEISITHDRDAVILQLTDMQIIDASQQRTPDRLKQDEFMLWQPENKEKLAYSHIRELVRIANPDLIVITGDIVYGEFDDEGSGWTEFIAFMDSFHTPWAITFGNHDNETRAGISWQCDQLEKSEYCLFKRGSVFGNSNYTVGIKRDGNLERVVYLVDSNGCGMLGIPQGFHEGQLVWMERAAVEYPENVPSFVCFHIPTDDFTDALIGAGYQKNYDASRDDFEKYEIGKDVPSKNGDFGKKHEWIKPQNSKIVSTLKACRTDGVFAGHCHKDNFSVLYDGIRYTMGLKTGLYDYHDDGMLGGTAITVPRGAGFGQFSVRHIYLDVPCEKCGKQ